MLQRRDKWVIGVVFLAIVVLLLINASLPTYMSPPLSPRMRAFSDLRTLATALETYRLDNGAYPPAVPHERAGAVISPVLTTPIVYLTKLTPHRYATDGTSTYIIYHPGPDDVWDITRPEQYLHEMKRPGGFSEDFLNVTFDPTNGATSRGDIWRLKD